MRIRLPRFQFGLRTFLLAIAIVAIGLWWYLMWSRYQLAKEEFERSLAAWDAGSATWMSILEASEKLCDAEDALPFVSRAHAMRGHLVRVLKFENRWLSWWDSYEGSPESFHERAKAIRDYREAQENALRKLE